jgi:hypothetical protein
MFLIDSVFKWHLNFERSKWKSEEKININETSIFILEYLKKCWLWSANQGASVIKIYVRKLPL